METISTLFSRTVTVDLSRSPQQALDATNRRQYTNANVVASMPKGQAQEEVFFFKPDASAYKNGWISDDNLEKQFDMRRVKPASPYTLAAVNEVDPAFADTHPNGTHWKDADGKWCYAAFHGWDGERGVGVYCRHHDWRDNWWFAGVRK